MSNLKLKTLTLDASLVARAHTYLALTAFSSALCLGLLLHYVKIVKNGVAGYPQEWFPSVSSTIGDWYPERNVFQILIALTSGPRFGLVFFQYFLHRSLNPSLSTVVFVFGIIRTLSCGGWVYITSSDDHDVHDFFMITYMVCNLPWMLGGIACTGKEFASVRKRRVLVSTAFFVSIVPLIYFFIQHKVHRVPGAYTYYSFFEWGLICFDVLYDSLAEDEFKQANLKVSIGTALTSSGTTDDISPSNQTRKSLLADAIQHLQKVDHAAPTASDQSVKQDNIMKSIHTSICQVWKSQHISYISDVYLAYIFWSIFTSLIPTLFYFSVWELGIAGHELAFLATLSPILFSIYPLLAWAQSREGQTMLQLLSLTGLGAYALASPVHRLLVVAPASALAILRQVASWSTDETGYESILTGLGLLLSSLSKHSNHSNNPVWPFVNSTSGGYNKTGLCLALLCLLQFYYRPGVMRTSAGKKPQRYHWLIAAIPLGGLMFTLHSLLSDSSTIIAWSWTGFDSGRPRGPLPHLHGSVTLIVQCLGLLLGVVIDPKELGDGSIFAKLTVQSIWFCFGAASSFVMYRCKDWLGYAGGLGLAFFTMAMIPTILNRAASSGATMKTYFTAMLVYCLLTLASVWTVAYAFVPGGVYLRERTDLVTIAQVACFALAFNWIKVNQSTSLKAGISRPVRSYVKTTLALVCTLSVLVTLYRLPSTAPMPYRSGKRIFRAGIWTLHFGIDNEGRDSQRRVRNLIRDMELDVVGLLETDLHRTVFGNRDLTRVIIEDMSYYVDLGPGPNSHTWGAVLLSKFLIISSKHHLLPSPHGELAPAIEAVLDIFGTMVTVVVAHNGQEEDPLDRELQSQELARIMAASYPKPVIFLGYVVTRPMAARPSPYEILIEDGKMHDIDQDDGDRWCEYILYRGLYRTSYARLSRNTVTDTELQVGQFILPRHGFSVTNDSHEGRYIRSLKETLSEEHWFPMAYYGNDHQGGVNGHYYHVFNTPLYYDTPPDAAL